MFFETSPIHSIYFHYLQQTRKVDLSFFNDRIGFNVTGYKTNTVNQLFTVALPPGSGASQFFTNGGDVEKATGYMVKSFCGGFYE